jgi:3-methylcrotonyl-CoA carboxylase alpha subunit
MAHVKGLTEEAPMEYKLRIGDREATVEVNTIDHENLDILIDGARYSVDHSAVSMHHLSLTIDGRAVNAYVSDSPDATQISINGLNYTVRDAEAQPSTAGRKKSRKELPQEITPPMPSVVVRILVSEGDTVAKGQGVIVVSAMKLETTLFAPFDGLVREVRVRTGEKVMPGQILVDIEGAKNVPPE